MGRDDRYSRLRYAPHRVGICSILSGGVPLAMPEYAPSKAEGTPQWSVMCSISGRGVLYTQVGYAEM